MTPQRLKAIKQLNATFRQAGPLAQALDEAIAEIDQLRALIERLVEIGAGVSWLADYDSLHDTVDKFDQLIADCQKALK